MLSMLVQLVVQLIFAAVTLAIRLAWLLGSLLGTLLVSLVGAGWNAWRSRHPTRSAAWTESAEPEQPTLPPSSALTVKRPEPFKPRPLRRRPRR